MKKVFLSLLLAFVALSLYGRDAASNSSKFITNDEISAKTLQKVLSSDLYSISEIDGDGIDFRTEDGKNFYLFVRDDHIMLYAFWEISEEVNEDKLNRIANDWNNYSYFKTNLSESYYFRLEYYLYTKGGVDSENLNYLINNFSYEAEHLQEVLAAADVLPSSY